MTDEEAGTGADRPRWDRRDALAAAALSLAGAAVRAAFVRAQELPLHDPWRHLQLLANLREGRGFTLFDGQPYLWYASWWYRFCALWPPAVGMDWIAALCSSLAVGAVYVLARADPASGSRRGAVVAAGLAACTGPTVAFTCHYGPEGLALLLAVAAVALGTWSRGALGGAASGLLLGTALVLRLHFAFYALLLLPSTRTARRALAVGAATALPLGLAWLRNRAILAEHAWVFTWDGLATPSDGFGWLSTLVVQMHPDVQEGLRRLHELIVPQPEWIRGPAGVAWGPLAFMLGGLFALLAVRRAAWLAAALATVVYFLLLDATGSSNFFRIWLPLFPLFCLAAGRLAARGTALPAALAAALLVGGGLTALRPPRPLPIELVTPPPAILEGDDAYLVNSTFFQPESLVYRFPRKRFAGLPLRPDRLEEFRAAFPGYGAILWHEFGVQDELWDHLRSSGRYRVAREATNPHGRRYTVYVDAGSAPPD